MLDLGLLSKAVEKGILSASQKDELVSFANNYSGDGGVAVHDEAPRFFRSFNDLFIGLGIAILGYALAFGTDLVTQGNKFTEFVVVMICAGIFWLLAEWIAGVRRINFPSIIIALIFMWFLINGLLIGWEIFVLGGEEVKDTKSFAQALGVVSVALMTSLAMLGFFWRFRLPFTVLLIAAGFAVTFIATLVMVFGHEAVEPFLRWIILAAGLLIFAAAMKFDFKDPTRSHRTSDHGFWLHLMAAPIITHSVLWTSLQPLMSNEPTVGSNPNLMVVIVFGMFFVFSIVALIIDRRALLISSLGYAATALGYIIYKFDIEGNLALVLTLLLIAVLILTLGTGWYKLRGWLFKILPDFEFFKRLPPISGPTSGV